MHTQIIGVVNVTPDSFFAGSRAMGKQALNHALQLINEGADILDIGGESTRPGSQPISSTEEIQRILPLISALQKETNTPISVDSYKFEVIQAAVEAGASIVNDITGLQDEKIRQLIADQNLSCIIMHMQGIPATMQQKPAYQNAVSEIKTFLQTQIQLCEADGIQSKNIIIDPGIGFGKTTQHNLEILRNLDAFQQLGKRVLIGASRKAFIGRILQSEENPLPAEERLEGSLAIVAHCFWHNVDFLRVHDVQATRRMLQVLETLSPK